MDVEDFKKKYEQLKDNHMYKNFCSILDTKSQVLERTAKENQDLKKENESLRQLQCTFLGTGCKRKMEEYESQQKEFIEWLVKMSKDLFQNEEYGSSAIYGYILSKYKEIIGVKGGMLNE